MSDLHQQQKYQGFTAKTPDVGRMPELYTKYGYRGETLYPFRTAVLREFMFPDIDGEKFMTESTMYLPISTKYKVHWLNLCVAESVYVEGGLTDRRFYHQAKSPQSTLLFYKLSAQCQPNFLGRVMNSGCYYAWKQVFQLKETELFDKYKVPALEGLLGYLLVPHYTRLFHKNIHKYCE